MIGSAAPAVTDSAVIFPFVSGELAYVLKVSGEVLWNVAVSGGRLGQAYATVGDITGDPVVVGDRLYVGNQSGRSMALDLSSGDEVWSAKTGAYGPMLVHGKAVFLVSDQGALMRLDRGTGERVWAEQLPNYKKTNAKKRKRFTHILALSWQEGVWLWPRAMAICAALIPQAAPHFHLLNSQREQPLCRLWRAICFIY